MDIGGIGSYGGSDAHRVKPQKPAEPTPPPGGNVENRRPPAEPNPPARTSASSAPGVGGTLNILV